MIPETPNLNRDQDVSDIPKDEWTPLDQQELSDTQWTGDPQALLPEASQPPPLTTFEILAEPAQAGVYTAESRTWHTNYTGEMDSSGDRDD